MANTIGFVVCIPISFLTHRSLSFRDIGNLPRSAFRYLGVIAVGYLCNLVSLHVLLAAGTAGEIAQICSVTDYIFVTYFGSARFVFLKPKNHTS